ncbi:8-amino-7-oxononanoate synthase [Piscinibacter sp. Jin2]|uniref:8-amino-7-oxononanoate synthase n=1 Tax=Aquariibacter lacus TaxID=2801332 RepID=A0A9X0XCE7_9BURK|nr:8-amino-7-oxononanoate synthase [Piscinibacter lacus]MBL0718989.1 8-amino-7-oxononanoate synthase [Piscinibacter lacus]
MPTPDAALAPELDDWIAQGLQRRRRAVRPVPGSGGVRLLVDGIECLAFCSNDYLGLAQHPALIAAAQAATAGFGAGATASPMVCGHSEAQAALETELAAFLGRPRALYFYAGYAANLGALPALVGRGDVIVSDRLNHACLIDGARLSGATVRRVPHADLAAVDAALAGAAGARRRLVVVDAVFSMDGDLADLPALLALCETHDAWLYIDDAHGLGVLGPRGQGSVAHWGLDGAPCLERLIHMATLGKAAGVAGGVIAGSETVIEWLLQRARTYMFATAAPPATCAALRVALRLIAEEPQRRSQLVLLRERLRAGLQGLPWQLAPSDTAIQPLIVGDSAAALALSAALETRGLWVPAIRPPTVPEGSARLRITLSAAHGLDDVDRLSLALQALAAAQA